MALELCNVCTPGVGQELFRELKVLYPTTKHKRPSDLRTDGSRVFGDDLPRALVLQLCPGVARRTFPCRQIDLALLRRRLYFVPVSARGVYKPTSWPIVSLAVSILGYMVLSSFAIGSPFVILSISALIAESAWSRANGNIHPQGTTTLPVERIPRG